MSPAPLWYKDAIFYEVFVRAFADSNGDGIGDLPGLTSRLEYLQDLGVDALWLSPIAPSPLRDDGYDVSDYGNVHADYGTLEDLRTLIAEAHRRNLRIVVELIPNHTSDQHPWFQASRDPHHPEHAKYRDWYVWSQTDQRYTEAGLMFPEFEPSNWAFDPARGAFYWHRFYHHQPDLNYDNPEVQRAMLRVAQFWLDQGVDGFRVDATPFLYERDGTRCAHLPETHAFFKRLRAFVEAYAPGAMLLSEASGSPEEVRAYFGDGDEFHMNFNFPLMPRIFQSLALADRTPIEQILAHTPELPASCQWATFLRCHDELTLAMLTPEDREFMWNHYAPEPRMRLFQGIRRRLAPLLNNDVRRIKLANALLLSLIGSPVLYYGDEIGMGDYVWLEDRRGVRTPMQWDDGPNAGFSTAPADRLYAPVIDDAVFSYQRVNVAAQRAEAGSLWHTLRRMLSARKAHPAFSRGTCVFLEGGTRSVLVALRAYDTETILIMNNLSPLPQPIQLDLSQWGGMSVRDLLAEREFPHVSDKAFTLTLQPYEYAWLNLS